jgi:drug/metabolite transporter (DMT)-like permease
VSRSLSETPAISERHVSDESLGYLFGFLGVLGFSVSLPAIRASVPEMGTIFVALGRTVVAGLLAAALLYFRSEKPPACKYWPGLAVSAFGITVGFPVCTAIALRHVPSSHGAVIIGLLPPATAIFAVLRAGEHPPLAFWIACAIGVVSVAIFAAVQGAGRPQFADLLLLLAVASAALGYAEGARIARDLGGWRVISWELVLAAPVLAVPVAIDVALNGVHAGHKAWAGFIYLSLVSMFLAFFAWYRGLALGGVARVGQMQLIQPILTLIWAYLWLGEEIDAWTIAASLLVIGSVALSRRAWTVSAAAESPPD